MPVQNKQYIYEHLQKQMDYVITQGYNYDNIIGIFLYGSQNYGLADNNSDVDSKLIVLPTFEEICLNTPPISKQYIYEDNEVIDVKDIRLYRQNLMKQNINYMETLFTQFCIANPKYEVLFLKYFVNNRENIAHYDRRKTMLNISGQIFNNLKHSELTQKRLYNAARLYYLLEDYVKNVPYYKCLCPKGEKYVYLWQLKYGRLNVCKDAETALKYAEDLEQRTYELIERYDYIPSKVNKGAAAALDNGVIELLRLYFLNEGATYVSKQNFFNQLTEKEKEAYNCIVSNMKDDSDYVVISQLIEKTHLSRGVFNNLFKKMKENHVAIIENAGVKGVKITIIQRDMKEDAQKWSASYVI